MKNQLSIQEKLWDLRRDHDYKLEEVAAAVNVVPATISKYENKENKEYNIVTLNKLADFYGVSLEWLVGNTEVRTSSLTEIDDLMLDDESIELLKSGRVDLAMVNMPIVMEGVFIVGEIPIRDCFVAGREYAKKFRGRHVTWQELSSHPLILLERKSSTRRFIDSCFAEKGIVINPEIELGSHDLLIDFASANLGIACAVREFSKKPLESGKVEIIDADPFPKRSIGIFTLREKSTPAAAALLSLLEL